MTGQTETTHPDRQTLVQWGFLLSSLPALIALALYLNMPPGITLILGLLVFGACFAINSSVHSYLIVAFAQRDAVSMDVGFYYMANAGGRLVGTLLSGFLYQVSGLLTCLIVSSVLIVLSTLAAQTIPTSD